MYKLVHTYTKSKIAHALSYAKHTLNVSLQYQACSNQERDTIIYVILEKK